MVGRRRYIDEEELGELIALTSIVPGPSSTQTTFFYRTLWVFPLLLTFGGFVAIVVSGERRVWNRVRLRPPYGYALAFASIAIGALALTYLRDDTIAWLFERFYRYGYRIIGGGQVVVPTCTATWSRSAGS